MTVTIKKSFYVFLCSILGALLFLILHRILVFTYLLLLSYDYAGFSLGLSFFELVALDYVSLVFTLFAGLWYGIWVGMHWYESVYQNENGGVITHFVRHYWPRRPGRYDLRSRIATVEDRLKGDFLELEGLAEQVEEKTAGSILPKRKIVRRTSPAKKAA